MILLAAIATFLAAAGLGGWAVRRHRQRTQALGALAERLGWTFEPVPPAGALGPLPALDVFSAGRGHALRNRMCGTRGGFPVWAADLRYVTGQPTGQTKATWLQTVVHVAVGPAHLPRFALRPRRFFHTLRGGDALHEVELGAVPIAERWQVRGEDDAAVAGLFGAEAGAVLQPHPLLFAEGAGADLYVWSTGVLATPAEMEPLLDAAVALAACLRSAVDAPPRAVSGGSGAVPPAGGTRDPRKRLVE